MEIKKVVTEEYDEQGNRIDNNAEKPVTQSKIIKKGIFTSKFKINTGEESKK